MTAREDHHGEGCQTNDQPQAAVIGGDHHVIANHAPYHHRYAEQQRNCGLPAEAFHGGNGRFLLAFTTLKVVFNGFSTVAGFLYGLH